MPDNSTPESVAALQRDYDILLQQLRESEERFVHLSNATVEGILVHDGSVILSCNRAYLSLCRIDDESTLIGTPIIDVVNDDGKATLATCLTSPPEDPFELDVPRHDGSHFRGSLRSSKTHTPDRTTHILTVSNISKRVDAERHLADSYTRLTRAEKMETAGATAGHIAHDLNNLLSPLLAYPPLIKMALPPDDQANRFVDEMERSARSMAHMSLQLLTLSRRGGDRHDVFNANRIIRTAIDLVSPITPDTIAVHTDLAEDLLPIQGNPDLMYRVLENLCQNAIDAMAERSGTLTLTSRNIYLEGDRPTDDSLQGAEYIQVTVSDTGPGIPADVQDQIFDPFFTTRRGHEERRSGLGLSIVRSIVKDHSGYTGVESSEAGTSISLYLPIYREDVEVSDQQAAGNGEHILVVDDDVMQLSIVGQLLTRFGYHAISATTSKDALDYLSRRPVDMVLLDIIMPDDISGLDLATQIRADYPDVKIAMVSGALDADLTDKIKSLGIRRYLSKPIVSAALQHTVHSELSAPSSAQGL